MNVILRIKRYQPETDDASRFQDFEVDVEPADRLLDALMFIKRNIDGTLCFRKSCAHGVCGSDAMTISGVERLACKTLIRDVAEKAGTVVTIEPLKSLPVQRDLMVDYTRFFEFYRVVKPFLVPAHKTEIDETIQTPAERGRFDDPTKCILCASCYASCPVVAEKDPDFIGPAAIVQAARFVFDSRDEGIGPRLDILDDVHGVRSCENHFQCTRVCPRGIKVTKNINLVKRQIKAFKEQSNQDT
ncbi:MAG: succinate dehydrogenase iron-sulfur subunit [Planctomycetota bacterium]|jgi:succinate dehydrogenase / fumarate reductase iron-sulfur subunit